MANTRTAFWPQCLWIARHGQSQGNVARDAAEAAGLPLIEIEHRDIDTPLSALGEQQAHALGRWFGDLPAHERPTIVMASPYVRARDTARAVIARICEAGGPCELVLDERLREKEFGVLDRLTKMGITAKFPELAEQRTHVGKFYFRPPGGESWCDVILRLRHLMDMLAQHHAGERVLIVAHQVIVNCFRYLLERLDEAQILAIDALGDVPNCGVTMYEFAMGEPRPRALVPRVVNFVAPLEAQGAPVTAEPDARTATTP
jgi:broad specificity phosphatase PhoE